mmetsp:Transcript_43190/g.102762  ORF Transcript_43190/g.102762 Transcript_43190/m.102762 type:complete len:253 (+) Transcript_43190:967-1725(+)
MGLSLQQRHGQDRVRDPQPPRQVRPRVRRAHSRRAPGGDGDRVVQEHGRRWEGHRRLHARRLGAPEGILLGERRGVQGWRAAVQRVRLRPQRAGRGVDGGARHDASAPALRGADGGPRAGRHPPPPRPPRGEDPAGAVRLRGGLLRAAAREWERGDRGGGERGARDIPRRLQRQGGQVRRRSQRRRALRAGEREPLHRVPLHPHDAQRRGPFLHDPNPGNLRRGAPARTHPAHRRRREAAGLVAQGRCYAVP